MAGSSAAKLATAFTTFEGAAVKVLCIAQAKVAGVASEAAASLRVKRREAWVTGMVWMFLMEMGKNSTIRRDSKVTELP